MVNTIAYNDETKTRMGIYCIILGALNIVIGLTQFIMGILEIFAIELLEIAFLPPDLFMGMCLAVIGTVFIFGVRPLLDKDDTGVSFLVGGSLIAIGFGILYLLIMISHSFMFLIQAEDFETWTFLVDIVPALWLSAFSIPGFIVAMKIRNVK
jgi:hypothetical protein